MELGGVQNIRWNKGKGDIKESKPPFQTSGYNMNILYMPPNAEYELKGREFIICVLRGNIVSLIQSIPSSESSLGIRKSLPLEKGGLLKSGENGCLLFVCRDEGDNNKYFDNISGLEIKWSKYDTKMYRTVPQIHVDEYRINLWYLGPSKYGGIHNHFNEPIPFVEFHTQLRGNGWMVKYENEKGEKELERVEMERGYTHDLFCNVKGKKVIYPWHEYIAGENGSLFIVFEDTRI